MKGKSSNDDLAQSGTHLPRETHQLGRQARIYPGGLGAGPDVLCGCSPPRKQGTLEETRLPLGGLFWWRQHGRYLVPSPGCLSHLLPPATTFTDDLEKVQIGSEGSLGLGPQPTLGGHGPLAI